MPLFDKGPIAQSDGLSKVHVDDRGVTFRIRQTEVRKIGQSRETLKRPE